MTPEEYAQVKDWITKQTTGEEDPILEVVCADIAYQLTRIANQGDRLTPEEREILEYSTGLNESPATHEHRDISKNPRADALAKAVEVILDGDFAHDHDGRLTDIFDKLESALAAYHAKDKAVG